MKTVVCNSSQDGHILSVCQWESLRPHPSKDSDGKNGKVRTHITGSTLPLTRHKHAVCCMGDVVYVFGGKDRSSSFRDVWQFHIKQQEWQEVELRGGSLPYLQGHSVVGHKRLILIFGGTFSGGLEDVQLWIFNTDLGHLCEVRMEPGSLQPTCRRDHSAVVYNSNMYIYGGFVDSSGSSKEFWAYSIEEEEWTEMTTQSQHQPGKRHAHSAVVANNSMWLYGGMCGLTSCADFWQYNFLLHQWHRVKGLGSPPPLSGHTANVVDGGMVLVGGSVQGKPVADVWLFNFYTATWQKLQISGLTVLPALCYHASISYNSSQFADGCSSCTRSMPHLKPMVKYQQRSDRFVVRPRSSPPVPKQAGNYTKRLQKRGPQLLGQRTQIDAPASTELASEAVRGSGAGIETVNSCHKVDDVHIQVNMKEPLLPPPSSHPADGSGDITSPLLSNKDKHSPLEDEWCLEEASCPSFQRCSFTNMTSSFSAPEQLSSGARELFDQSSTCPSPDNPSGLDISKGGRSTAEWRSHGCWDDLFIQDLEMMEDQNGVDDVKINYPSKNPFLPLTFPRSECHTYLESRQQQQHLLPHSHQQPHHHQQPHNHQQYQHCDTKLLGQDQQHQDGSTTLVQLLPVCRRDMFGSFNIPFSQHSTKTHNFDEHANQPENVVSGGSSNLQQSVTPLSCLDHHTQDCPAHIPLNVRVTAETSFIDLPECWDRNPCTLQEPVSNTADTSNGTVRATERDCPVTHVSGSDCGGGGCQTAVDIQLSPTPRLGTPYQVNQTSTCLLPARGHEIRLITHSLPVLGSRTGLIDGNRHQFGSGHPVKMLDQAEPRLLVFGGRIEEMGSLHPKPMSVWKGVFW